MLARAIRQATFFSSRIHNTAAYVKAANIVPETQLMKISVINYLEIPCELIIPRQAGWNTPESGN
jgi:hypothetical protein